MGVRRAVATAGVVALLVTAGTAGVGGAETRAKPKPLSKKELIKAGDDICRQGNQLANELAQRHFGQAQTQPDAAAAASYVAELAPIIKQELDSIRRLPAPTADRKKLRKIVDTAVRELRTMKRHPSSAVDGTALTKSAKLARAYGFKVCGNTNSSD